MSVTITAGANGFSVLQGTGTSPTAVEPAAKVNGDVFVALALSAASGAITNPAGWTNLYNGTQTGVTWRVAWIQRGASAPNLTWGLTGSVYREVYIVCLHPTSPGTITLDSQSAAGTSGTGSTNPDPPTTTAVASSSMAIAGGLNFFGSGTGGWTVSTGYTIRTANTNGDDGFLESKALAASGVENPSAVGNVGGSGDFWHGFTLTFTDVSASTNPFVTNLNDRTPIKLRGREEQDYASNFNLLKDKIFGAAGQTQTYDYPNPHVSPRLALTHTDSFKLELRSKDQFFGSFGQVPTYDWPSLPKRLNPPPTHLDSFKLELISQDKFFGVAGNPLTDYPNPKTAPFVLKSHTDSFKLELIGQDALPIGFKELGSLAYQNKLKLDYIINLLENTLGIVIPPPPPFFLTEWPLPFTNKDTKSFIDETKIQLIGQDFVLLPSYDQPNPVKALRNLNFEELLNLLSNTLGIIPTPFAQYDWSNPKKFGSPQTFLDETKINLIGQDLIPIRNFDQSLPVGRIAIIDLRTLTVDLLQTTLKPAPILGDNGLIYIEGRIARKLNKFIYVYVD